MLLLKLNFISIHKIIDEYSNFLQQLKFAEQFRFLGRTFECFHSLYGVFG